MEWREVKTRQVIQRRCTYIFLDVFRLDSFIRIVCRVQRSKHQPVMRQTDSTTWNRCFLHLKKTADKQISHGCVKLLRLSSHCRQKLPKSDFYNATIKAEIHFTCIVIFFYLSAGGILLDMQFLLGAYMQRLAEGTKLVFKRDISLSKPEVLLIKGYPKSVAWK